MSKHTPGPWHWNAEWPHHVYYGDQHTDDAAKKNAITYGGCGCCSYWNDGVLHPADARLIAAAPDLLAALRNLVDAQYDGDPKRQDDPLIVAARAAIAKATGAEGQ